MLQTGLSAAGGRHSAEEEADFETYLLLLLSDSNLPTGGFVASSGLESFHAHGLLHNSRPTAALAHYGPGSPLPSSSTAGRPRPIAPSQAQLSSATLSFARSTLHSYSRSSFPFLARAHAAVHTYLGNGVSASVDRARARAVESSLEQTTADQAFDDQQQTRLQACLHSISRLDHSYHTLLLNHVARRASKAQGIALLTLYTKAFAKPINLDREPFPASPIRPNPNLNTDHASSSPNSSTAEQTDREKVRIELAAHLVDKLKSEIRKAQAQHEGHLPICWAVFAACLGLSLNKAVYLHLFLQARSLFSSSIRLNTLGPYLAHQVMRFQMRGVVQAIIQEMIEEGCLQGKSDCTGSDSAPEEANEQEEHDETETENETVVAYTLHDVEMEPTSQTKTVPSEPRPASPARRPAKPFRTTSTMSLSPNTYGSLNLRTKVHSLRIGKEQLIPVDDSDPSQGWAWDWPEEQDTFHLNGSRAQEAESVGGKNSERGFWTSASAPATTFPLGEIVQARHDQLHSRLFNS